MLWYWIINRIRIERKHADGSKKDCTLKWDENVKENEKSPLEGTQGTERDKDEDVEGKLDYF